MAFVAWRPTLLPNQRGHHDIQALIELHRPSGSSPRCRGIGCPHIAAA
jgi:hypothetical protein